MDDNVHRLYGYSWLFNITMVDYYLSIILMILLIYIKNNYGKFTFIILNSRLKQRNKW